MNERLAVEILQRIKEGSSFGFHTIKNDLRNTETYFDLKDQEYAETIQELIQNGCIETRTNPKEYYINPQKGNCLDRYEKAVAAADKKILEDETTSDLSSKKLKIDYLNAERVYKTYKTTKILAIIGAASGSVAILLKIAELFGWLPIKK